MEDDEDDVSDGDTYDLLHSSKVVAAVEVKFLHQKEEKRREKEIRKRAKIENV